MSQQRRGDLPEKVEGFRIGALLGKGGMGEVYRGYDERLERPVAIKVIRPEVLENATMRGRFLREARTAAQLNHAAIVQIYQILECEIQDYIVMELLEGKTLSDLLRDGPMELERALALMRHIAGGLAAAHSKGIVHRDLKAGNILVTAGDRPKILDFGLAKHLHRSTALSSAGAVVGTFHCMSPEQAQGRKVDHRSDLFSFGVLLYQVLTGRKPFQGRNTGEILARICTQWHVPVWQVDPKIPHGVSSLIDQLLEKDPGCRPARAADVEALLARLSEGGDFLAEQDATLEQTTIALDSGTSPRSFEVFGEFHGSSAHRQSQMVEDTREAHLKAPVLYVDDEESNLVLFERVFEDDYEIHTARSAREAIDILRRQAIHLVITDQRMPGMTGVQLLEVIQAEFPETVRMILTCYSEVDAIINAINMGRVYQYITKPWEENELRVVIDRALETFGLHRRNRQLLEELKQKVAREKEIRRVFQRYVPPTVVDSLLDDRGADRFRGESRIVAVLYTDVHDFSRLSARLAPAQVVAFLNRYLSIMHNVVASHRGTVRDSNLSVFGAPMSSLDNAENAVLTALEMRGALVEFNRREALELVGEEISMGLGIHLGEVITGNIGSDEKMEYSVVGEAVNRAAKICQLGSDLPNSILISERVLERTRELIEVEPWEPSSSKGDDKDDASAIPLYRVMSRRIT